jgi:hypothetical protein
MMWSRRLVALFAAALTASACEDALEPEVPTPRAYSYEVTVAGDLAESFSGATEVITIRNGMAEPWPPPSGELFATDRTWFALVPVWKSQGLSFSLHGPIEPGVYTLRVFGERIDPAAKTFEAGYSVQTGPGVFRHYKISEGTVTISIEGFLQKVSFAFAADTAEHVTMGHHQGWESLPVQISGSLTELPRQ